MISISYGIIELYAIYMFNLIKNMPNHFLKWLLYFVFLPTMYETFTWFTTLPTLGGVNLLNFSLFNSRGYVMVSQSDFNLHFMNDFSSAS